MKYTHSSRMNFSVNLWTCPTFGNSKISYRDLLVSICQTVLLSICVIQWRETWPEMVQTWNITAVLVHSTVLALYTRGVDLNHRTWIKVRLQSLIWWLHHLKFEVLELGIAASQDLRIKTWELLDTCKTMSWSQLWFPLTQINCTHDQSSSGLT